MHRFEFERPEAPQLASSLFTRFPGEVRNLIHFYALSEYAASLEDVYDADTCYRRPDYFARGRVDSALLRTCQRVFKEAWFLPWTSREHTFFLTSRDRRPEVTTTVEDMRTMLGSIYERHGEEATSMSQARVFAQLFSLEPGDNLQAVLDLPHFNPKVFTITLRHTDWWGWEHDMSLHIKGGFAARCRFPDSVSQVRMELEGLDIRRRRLQVQDIARQIREKWSFRRRDGSHLLAEESLPDTVSRWEGSSTWNDQRWIRDETKPGRLEYYVQTIKFTGRCTTLPSDDSRANPAVLNAIGFTRLGGPPSYANTGELRRRGIENGHSAEEVRRFLALYQVPCICKSSGLDCCGEGLGAGWTQHGGDLKCQNCILDEDCSLPDPASQADDPTIAHEVEDMVD